MALFIILLLLACAIALGIANHRDIRRVQSLFAAIDMLAKGGHLSQIPEQQRADIEYLAKQHGPKP